MTVPAAGPNLLRVIVHNTVTLTGGRLLIALLRFTAALMLVQRAGLTRFGEISLILSFVMVAEWLSDFGLADVAVRQIAANPQRRASTMTAFAASKVSQGLIAAAIMWGTIDLAGYSAHIVRSALIAGAAVVAYSGVQVYRVIFRSDFHVGRDVGAEVLSAAMFLLTIGLATAVDASLEVLTLCYVLSRAANLVAAVCLARGLPQFAFGPEFRSELRVLALASVPLGLTGLMISAYDAMDAIALSRWSTSSEVGIFTFDMRIVMLAIVAEQALATAVFPLLSALWAQDRNAFERTLQTALDWGMVAAGAALCAIYAGAGGLAAFAKQDPQAISGVLQLLAWSIPARVAVTLVAPMLVISGRLIYAVWIPVVVVIAKWCALTQLASHGAIGAAGAYLIAEIGVGLLPNLIFCQRAAGIWLNWSVPLKLVGCAAAVAGASRLLSLDGTLLDGVLAVAVYCGLAALLGTLRIDTLQRLVRSIARRRATHV